MIRLGLAVAKCLGDIVSPAGQRHPHVVTLEVVRDHLTDRNVILDKEDARRRRDVATGARMLSG
jgi:hypothetical protein